MIRNEAIREPEEWEGRDVILSLLIPGVGLRLERVQITKVTASFLLCRDINRRDQVYTISHIVGWEPFDGVSELDLVRQDEEDVVTGRVTPPPALPEDSGIRKVHQVGKVRS